MRLRLWVKLYSLVAVPLIFELVFVSALVFFQGQLQNSYNKEIEARQLANVINRAMAGCIKAGTYWALYGIDQDKSLLRDGRVQLKKLIVIRKELLDMHGLSKADEKSIQGITDDLDSIFKNFADPLENPEVKDKSYLMSLNLAVEGLLEKADDILYRQAVIQDAEKDEQARLRTLINNSVIGGVVLNVVLAIFLVGLLNKNIIGRLNVVLENARRLATGKELLPRVEGRDEVAVLDSVFHDMAVKIERSLEREKALVVNSSDVIFAVDSLMEVTLMSSSASRLWGYEPEELIGSAIEIFVFRDDQEAVRNALLSLDANKQSKQIEIRIQLKDGETLDASLSAYFSPTDAQIYCVAHDISERKKLERQKEDFLSMVSHDLRSPITSLILTFDMLISGALGKLTKKGDLLANTSRNDLSRLQKMVNDLLDADRLEKGKLEIELARCNSTEISNQVLQSVAQQIDKKQIQLESRWPSIAILCDKDRLIQVMINLVSNAIKFSDKGSKIEMNLKPGEKFTEIEVVDEGCGIPEENLDSIFDKFKQVSRRDAVEKGGSGLGLAICKALVEAHSGSIGVESKVDKGSRFWIKLPAQKNS